METLAELFDRIERLGRREAIRFHNGFRSRRVTYAELAERAKAFARHLENLKLERGDRVLLWGENQPEWTAAFWGCVLRGVAVVPIDRGFSPALAARIASESGVRLAVLDERIRLDHGQALRTLEVELIGFDDLAALPSGTPTPVLLGADDIVEIVYTSGTTGRPRGVVHRHRHLCSNLSAIGAGIDRYRSLMRPFQPIRMLVLLPLSHLFGQSLGIFLPPLLGGAAAFSTEMNPAAVLAVLRRERISVLVGVPRMLANLQREVARSSGAEPSAPRFRSWLGAAESWWRHRGVHRATGWKFWAFVVGGARLDPQLEQFWRRLGFVVVQGYGLTESSPVIALNHPFSTRGGSIGKALAGQEVKLAPDGEILVRGPSVVDEYLGGDGGATRMESGWLRTGDLAEMDEQGRLYFKGRKKDVIVRPDGLNVYPDDVEPTLRALSGVKDAVVLGLPREGGEQVHAVLLLENAGGATSGLAEDLVRQANARLESHQRIQGWTIWAEADFPRTSSTLKVRRHEVLQRLAELDARPAMRPPEASGASALRDALARRTGRPPEKLTDDLTLEEDLALSSLDRIDLLTELEDALAIGLDEFAYAEVRTVGELEAFLRQSPALHGWPTVAAPEAQTSHRREPALAPVKVHLPGWNRRLPVRWTRALLQDLAILPMVRELVRLKVRGLENLEGISPPAIFVANHVSHFDTAVILAALPRRWRRRLAPAMSQDYFRAWLQPRDEPFDLRLQLAAQYFLALGLFNAYPLPQRMGGARRALQYTGDLVDAGYCPLVYPEGLRSPDGKMTRFQDGIGLMATKLGAPIIPVYIDGLFEVYSIHQEWPREGNVTVWVGEALYFSPNSADREAANAIERGVLHLCDISRSSP